MPKMDRFTMLPSGWITSGCLDSFASPKDAVPELKVLLALTVLQGEHQLLSGQRKVMVFPAPLARLTEESSLSRTHTSSAVQLLLEHGRIERALASECSVKVDPRTAAYRFTGDVSRFFPVPYAHLRDQRFLQTLRERTAANLAALKIYLIIGALRNSATGITQVSYDKLAGKYGVPRKLVHRAINTLAGGGLIQMGPARDLRIGKVAAPPNQYKVMGLDRTTHLSADTWDRAADDSDEEVLATERQGQST